jgi:hypothetical protein
MLDMEADGKSGRLPGSVELGPRMTPWRIEQISAATHAIRWWCVAEAQEPTNLGSFLTA